MILRNCGLRRPLRLLVTPSGSNRSKIRPPELQHLARKSLLENRSPVNLLHLEEPPPPLKDRIPRRYSRRSRPSLQ
jgi:hypothetical protein